MRIIPPADMAELVKLGIAPCEIPNWDKNDPDSAYNLRYRKFSPERKIMFLTKLEQHGRTLLACRFAGISHQTVLEHRKADPEFEQAVKDAEAMYHEMCVASILHQARVGQIDERWDKEGHLISRRVSYETKLREMIVKRADSSYNDVSRQEVAVVGGAVVVPAPVDSVDSWDAIVARHTGSPAASPGTLSEGPVEPGKALSEGRVVKRRIVETSGVEADSSGVEASEPSESAGGSEEPATE
jgi:hypothetical protein